MNDKLRILIVHNRYQIPGGEDTVVQNETAMLKKYGHEVFLYERNNSEMKDYGLIQKMSLPFNTIYSKQSKNEIKALIKQNDIDLVHVHNTLLLISPSVYDAAKECHVPVVQTIHNFRFLCPNGIFFRDGHVCEDCLTNGLNNAVKHSCYRGSKAQTLIVTQTLKRMRANHVFDDMNCICLTPFNKDKLLSSGMFKEKNLFIKPNFVEKQGSLIPYAERKNQCVYAGRIEEMKGFPFLIEAWASITDAPKLIVCGDGPLFEQAKEYVAKNNVSNIELRGRVDHEAVLNLLKESKAMIFASKWYEGFPMSITESLACGTPVLVPDFGNAGSLITEGVNGFHYALEDKASFAEGLNKLLEKNDYDLSSMASAYTEEENYKTLLNIYDTAIQRMKGEQ